MHQDSFSYDLAGRLLAEETNTDLYGLDAVDASGVTLTPMAIIIAFLGDKTVRD